MFPDLIDKKESTLEIINKIDATPVNSSSREVAFNFVIFIEVKTKKQNPNKFDEVDNICVEVFLVTLSFPLNKTFN